MTKTSEWVANTYNAGINRLELFGASSQESSASGPSPIESLENPTLTIRGRILWPTVVQYAFMSPGIAVNILGNGYRLTSVSGTTRFARTEVILLKPNTRYPFSVQVDFAVQPKDSNVGLIWVFRDITASDYDKTLLYVSRGEGYPSKSFVTDDTGRICLNTILTGATSESADFTIYNIQIPEGAYTADTLPPYEPNRSAAIPIPYILHGFPDVEGGWAARDQLIMDRAGQTVIVIRRIDGEKLDPIRSIYDDPEQYLLPSPAVEDITGTETGRRLLQAMTYDPSTVMEATSENGLRGDPSVTVKVISD